MQKRAKKEKKKMNTKSEGIASAKAIIKRTYGLFIRAICDSGPPDTSKLVSLVA